MAATRLQYCRLLALVSLMLGAFALPAATPPIPEQDCVIEPHTVVDLASAVEGIVESVDVARGDLVEKNQVLVRLDSGVERAAVDYARARAEASAQVRAGEANASFAQRRAGRVGALYEQKVVSSDQMDEAATQTRLTRAQAEQAAENQRLAQLELRQAQENLARHIIRSPIRGVVVQDYLSPGESVKDKPILRLAEIDPLRVEVIVPVTFFGAIVPGQSATIRPEAPREGSFPAKVSIVDRVADAASGTFRVRLTLPNPDYSLPSGLKCRVQFGPALAASPLKPATPAAKPASPTTPAVPGAPAAPVALPGDTIAGERPPSSYPRTRRLAHSAYRPIAPAPVEPEVAQPAAVAAAPVTPPAVASTPAAAARETAATPPSAAANMPVTDPSPWAAPARSVNERVARTEISSAPGCRTLGPIESSDRAEQIKALLAARVTHLEIRAGGSDEPAGFVILTPPQPTPEDARALAEQMRKAGVDDLYLFTKGTYRNRVGLGVYASRARALVRREAVAAKGFQSAVMPRSAPENALWLDMEVGSTPAAVESLNRIVATVAPGLNLATVPCIELVASRH